MSPRPTMTPEIARQASQEIVARLLKRRLIDRDSADAIAHIARSYRAHMDGYELARALEERYHWICDFAIAEVLNDLSGVARDLLLKAQKTWADTERPKPPYSINDRIKLRNSGKTGIITEIRGPSQFLVAIDGDPQAFGPSERRSIVNFEDALPVEAVSA